MLRSKAGTRMIAGSLNRLNRNGRTASSESGPPRLNRTIAVRVMVSARKEDVSCASGRTDHGNQPLYVLGWRLRDDAVPQIKDEWSLCQPVDDVSDAGTHATSASRQELRIEIALQASMGLQLVARPVEWNTRIKAEALGKLLHGEIEVAGTEIGRASCRDR